MATRTSSNPLSQLIGGAVCGVLLTWLYVRFGFTLPGIARIGETVTSEAAIIAAESGFYDPGVGLARRYRALSVIVKERPDLLIEADRSLGGPLFDELLRRRAVRIAEQLRQRGTAYDKALRQPSLRRSLERRYGAADDKTLKQRMFLADIAREKVLAEHLRKHFPEADAGRRAEIVRQVGRNHLKPARVTRTATADRTPPQ